MSTDAEIKAVYRFLEAQVRIRVVPAPTLPAADLAMRWHAQWHQWSDALNRRDSDRVSRDQLIDQHPEAPDVHLGRARQVGDGVGGFGSAGAGTADLGPADPLGRDSDRGACAHADLGRGPRGAGAAAANGSHNGQPAASTGVPAVTTGLRPVDPGKGGASPDDARGDSGGGGGGGSPTRVVMQPLSSTPPIWLIRNFLSADECATLVAAGTARLALCGKFDIRFGPLHRRVTCSIRVARACWGG